MNPQPTSLFETARKQKEKSAMKMAEVASHSKRHSIHEPVQKPQTPPPPKPSAPSPEKSKLVVPGLEEPSAGVLSKASKGTGKKNEGTEEVSDDSSPENKDRKSKFGRLTFIKLPTNRRRSSPRGKLEQGDMSSSLIMLLLSLKEYFLH